MPAYAGAATPGGDAGHDLERDAGLAQHQRLLAAAPEHERVAALEAHDAAAGARVLDQQPVDLVLRHLRPAALLADVDQLGVRARAYASASGGISRSCRITSAAAISSTARTVSRPGSPGPAPTRWTIRAHRAPPSTSASRSRSRGARGEHPRARAAAGRLRRRRRARRSSTHPRGAVRAGRRSRASAPTLRAVPDAHRACDNSRRASAHRGPFRRTGSATCGHGAIASGAAPAAALAGPGLDGDRRPGPAPGRTPRRRACRRPRGGGRGGRARRRRARARRPRRRRACAAGCRRCRAARRPRGRAARRAAARAGAARWSRRARPRARRRASARRRARRAGRPARGAADDRRAARRARPARPWPSAPRGRCRPRAAPPRARRSSATCRRARGRRRRPSSIVHELGPAPQRGRDRPRLGERERAAAGADAQRARRSRRRRARTSAGGGSAASPVGSSSPNSSRSSCSRAWRCSASSALDARGRLVQQALDDGAGERLDALAVAVGERLPAAGVLGQQLVDDVVAARAQRARRVGSTSSGPSQPANVWISSSTIPSARARLGAAHRHVPADTALQAVDVEHA